MGHQLGQRNQNFEISVAWLAIDFNLPVVLLDKCLRQR